MMFTYPDFPQALSSAGGAVDLHVWKNVMISLESANQTFAVDTYNRLVPEPAGPQASAAPALRLADCVQGWYGACLHLSQELLPPIVGGRKLRRCPKRPCWW